MITIGLKIFHEFQYYKSVVDYILLLLKLFKYLYSLRRRRIKDSGWVNGSFINFNITKAL